MQNFDYCTPTRLIFGEGCISQLPEVLSSYGKRVLLTYGGGSIKRSGLYDSIKALLKDFEVHELSGIEPNPRYSTSVLSGIKICREKKIDVILAVGGGSVLDCSKAISAGALFEGKDPWQMIMGAEPVGQALPLVDIITMAATGSEYDPVAVISRTETNDKVDFYSEKNYPAVSFIDPTYTYSLPKRQMTAGVADAMNHVFETYFNDDPNGMADGMMESCLRSLMKNVRLALKNPEDYKARSEISLCCTLACNGILGIGENYSGWPMHAIEYALSVYYDLTHGVGLAIITPRWMRQILNERTEGRIAQYGINVLGIDPKLPTREIAERAIDETFAFFEELGLPMHLREVGIDESRLEEMAHHVFYDQGRDWSWMYAPLTEGDILSIFRASL